MLMLGDCRVRLRELADNSVDSIVTDPPYDLTSGKGAGKPDGPRKGFMGKAWDGTGVAFDVATWVECLRVLKPGGHLLAFGGTRTNHRMVCAIEDAGFEVRDGMIWVYGNGFPKSLDISKAIDKARDDSADGLVVGVWLRRQREAKGLQQKQVAVLWPSITGGLTGCVANWETLGKVPKWDQWLKLKEFIGFGDEMDDEVWRLNGRKGKPGEAWNSREVIGYTEGGLGKGNFVASIVGPGGYGFADEWSITIPNSAAAQQWAGYGTALKPAIENIALARKPPEGTIAANVLKWGVGGLNVDASRISAHDGVPIFTKKNENSNNCYANGLNGSNRTGIFDTTTGRWPANLIHDGSPEVLALFPETLGGKGGDLRNTALGIMNDDSWQPKVTVRTGFDDSGSAARFFKCCPFIDEERIEQAERILYCPKADKKDRGPDNNHPTLKPSSLLRYLCRLITPPGGIVLDPFAGAGSTGKAAILEGFRFAGVELEPDHIAIAERRIAEAVAIAGQAKTALQPTDGLQGDSSAQTDPLPPFQEFRQQITRKATAPKVRPDRAARATTPTLFDFLTDPVPDPSEGAAHV